MTNIASAKSDFLKVVEYSPQKDNLGSWLPKVARALNWSERRTRAVWNAEVQNLNPQEEETLKNAATISGIRRQADQISRVLERIEKENDPPNSQEIEALRRVVSRLLAEADGLEQVNPWRHG